MTVENIHDLDLRAILGPNWFCQMDAYSTKYHIGGHWTATAAIEFHPRATTEQIFAATKHAKREALKTLMEELEKQYEALK